MGCRTEGTPDRLLKVTTTVFYNGDQEEARDQKREIKEKTEMIVAALQTARPQGTQDRNTSCDSCGWSGHLAPDSKDHHGGDPQGPVLSAERVAGRQMVLRGPADATGLKGPGGPHCGSFNPVVHGDAGAPRDPRGQRKAREPPSGYRSHPRCPAL